MSNTVIKRRDFLTGMAAGVAMAAVLPVSASDTPGRKTARNVKKNLLAPEFIPLPLGAITPEGWLQRQLRLQADGLSGHLDEFWPDVGQSKWFGGTAEGWERAPYWLDGVVPLAWILDDKPLKEKINRYVKHIVEHQRPDGWYAPYPADASAKAYDMWSILLANKVLVQYHEATGDEKVMAAVVRNLKALLGVLDHTPLFGWGKFRWFEGLVAVYYVYERTGEAWLMDLARKLYEQRFDYMAFFNGEDILSPTPRRGLWRWDKHVVNVAMSLKAYALSYRMTGLETDRAFHNRMFEVLDRYHGQVTGMFSGDECLSGKSPTQGTELCAVVETMYSLENIVSVAGTVADADRLERIAFNALPATFSPDMWAHQYDQQVNQVQATINPEFMWSTNGGDSNLFGLEPNFGCCTSNMHQGWPKLVANLWMRTKDEGIAAVAYAPSTARFAVRGSAVQVQLKTDYPFRESLQLTVTAEKPVRFPLVLRVPSWAQGATVRVVGASPKAMKLGSWHRIEREWKGQVVLEMVFPMQVKTSRRYNQALAIERGPLVYSLKMEEKWTRVNADKPHRELPHGDFEIRPGSAWNYGLLVDEKNPSASVQFQEQPVGAIPFSPEGAGMKATVKGRKLPGWKLDRGWAAEVPPEPQNSREPIEELTLIPYGCAKIRVTEFPRLVK